MAQVIDNDLGWRRIERDIAALRGRSVRVGLWGGEGAGASDTAIVDYAMFNEFGTRTIPARPFMATTADRHGERTMNFAERLAGQIVDGKNTPDRVLQVLGEYYQRMIQRTIRDSPSWAVENAPSTIRQKGSSKPLVDTGSLIRAIRYEVE